MRKRLHKMSMVLLLITGLTLVQAQQPSGECPPSQTLCEYWFTVKEKLTMVYHKDLVYPHDGRLFKFDEHPDNYTTNIPIDEVVTVDGVNRMVIAVNETVPGPPIIVYEGQTVRVHVHNKLLSDSVSIHWHGLHQYGTPYMDGVAYVTQCPISAGQTFTYEFKASPKGTFWYHSHIGAQRSNGLFGALIVKPGNSPNIYRDEFIMQVGDWHHESSEEVYIKMVYGNFIGRTPYKTTQTLDGGKFSGVPWVSAHIEGRGRYIDPKTGTSNGAPLTRYTVQSNGVYRFRLIGVGTIYPLEISVDKHTLVVIASDGYEIEPVLVQAFIINPGERFDFLIRADKPIGNYWIRAVSVEAGVKNHSVEAILHYEGAEHADPVSSQRPCTATHPCVILNCPFKYYPDGSNNTCMLMDQMRAMNPERTPEYEPDSEEHFLNFAFPGEKVTPGAVNGRKFEFPGVNSLVQHDAANNYNCDRQDCGEDKVCYCHYQLEVPFNKTIQMVWMNMGSGAGWGHPIHIHGHSFHLLKMVYPEQNRTSGRITGIALHGNHRDIDCGGGKNFCNSGRWFDPSWKHGKIPGLNLRNPPRKDTIIIPTGGYAVLRIRSDNPGKWFMHCHIEVHALDGMAMILNEAPKEFPKPPNGLPVCDHFYNDQTRDVTFLKNGAKLSCANNLTLVAVISTLAAIAFIQLCAIIAICCRKAHCDAHCDAQKDANPPQPSVLHQRKSSSVSFKDSIRKISSALYRQPTDHPFQEHVDEE